MTSPTWAASLVSLTAAICACGTSSRQPPSPREPGAATTATPLSPPSPNVGAPPPIARDYDHVLGDVFQLGEFTYRVRRAHVEPTVGTRLAHEAAAGGAAFLIVEFDETNEGSETATVTEGAAQLLDTAGHRFHVSSRGMAALAMSGDAELALAELQPGVTRPTTVVFEVPNATTRDLHLVLEMEERGALAAGHARVLLHGAREARLQRLMAEVVHPVLIALRHRDLSTLRGLFASAEGSTLPETTLAAWCGGYNDALAHHAGTTIGYDHGVQVVTGDDATLHLQFVPASGVWHAQDGEMVVGARDVGGRYRVTTFDLHPPAP